MNKLLKEYKYLLLILFVATLLRFAYLSSIPPSLNWDEVSHGYNAFSILKTGKDEWGELFPSIFRAYGDYKLPVYIYLTALTEFILGLNVLSVRIISALSGLVVLIFSYLLANKLFNKKVATLTAVLVAVEPWSLFLSRAAFEANLALAFIVSGVYFLLTGLEKPKRLILSAVLLGLSLWSYNSARIFVPLFLLFALLLYRKSFLKIYKKKKTTVITSVFVFLIFFVPMVLQLVNPVGQARYGWVAIIDEGAISQINESRANSGFSPGINRIIYNKGTYFVRDFGNNWLSHYSPKFLFLNGGDQFQFSVPGHGILYPINALFFLVGILYMVKKRSRESLFILGWLILGPIASSLTREAPHVLRSITTLPAPMIITAIGVLKVWSWLKNRKEIFAWLFLFMYSLILIVQFGLYIRLMTTSYVKNYSWSWQYGYEQVIGSVKANYEDYDKIIFSKKYGEPHEFILFFWPWNPEEYRDDPVLNRFFQSNWYWVDGFDKFYFVNDWQINEEGTGVYMFNLESGGVVDCLIDNCLLITSPDNVPKEWDKLETIYFLNGKPAFEIYDNR